jgi:hypothetical protein
VNPLRIVERKYNIPDADFEDLAGPSTDQGADQSCDGNEAS